MALNKAKVISVTSVKGGAGKTTTVLNLAGILSRMNKKVLVVDLDFYSGDIAASLNINYENDIYNLYEDLNNKRFDNFDFSRSISVMEGYKTAMNYENEFLEIEKTPINILVDKILSGEIKDSKTQAAILKVNELIRQGKI